jgi:hypothetical protein
LAYTTLAWRELGSDGWSEIGRDLRYACLKGRGHGRRAEVLSVSDAVAVAMTIVTCLPLWLSELLAMSMLGWYGRGKGALFFAMLE